MSFKFLLWIPWQVAGILSTHTFSFSPPFSPAQSSLSLRLNLCISASAVLGNFLQFWNDINTHSTLLESVMSYHISCSFVWASTSRHRSRSHVFCFKCPGAREHCGTVLWVLHQILYVRPDKRNKSINWHSFTFLFLQQRAAEAAICGFRPSVKRMKMLKWPILYQRVAYYLYMCCL